MESLHPITAYLAVAIAVVSAALALVARELWTRGRDIDARFKEFANAMPLVVFTTDADGVVTFVNQEFTTLTGALKGAALDTGYLAYIHPDDQGVFHTLRRGGLASGKLFALEYRLRTMDGYRWRQMRLVPVHARDGRLRGWYGTAIDIDEVKRDAVRLREQAAILDQVREGILVRDLEHRVVYWNRGAETLYGWTADEVRGRAVTDFLYSPESRVTEADREVLSTGQWHGRLDPVRKDGKRLAIDAHWTLVRDDAGAPVSIVGIHLDITDRLALEERLQQAMRLEAIGELSGGLAHDFNNLLTVILGNSELLASRLGADPRLRALAEMTRGAAQRGAALTQRMLAFARRQVLDPGSVDVGESLRGMRANLSSTLREDIILTIQTADGLWNAEVDRTQLENAIVSLCVNAREAMPQGGAVRISASNADLTAADAARANELAPGRYVRIEVADEGLGIAPEVLNRVFDPFFTTKQRSKGTGLGLSMVYGFAKQSAGLASIASTPGAGTTVTLLLPVATPAPRSADVLRAPDHEAGGETILVTEDDELVRGYVCEQLGTLGYVVVPARDASEAMAVLEAGRHVDLLFTDIVMPGRMNGRQLADAARVLRPGLAVLFTSGYPDDMVGTDGKLEAGLHLLGKPYRRAELAQKLRAALASRGHSELGRM